MTETWYLLNLIGTVRPGGQNDWDRITEAYNEKFEGGDRYRDRDSLKRRFSALHTRKVPTGDADCPKEVRAAKDLVRYIESRCDAGEGVDESDLEFIEVEEDAGYDEVEEDEQEEHEDNNVNKDNSNASDNPTPPSKEIPKLELDPNLEDKLRSKPLRSATQNRKRGKVGEEDGKDNDIMRYLILSQQKRQDAEERDRQERREKEKRELEERRERDERRERQEQLRAEQALQMQQSMMQMMFQQQTNMMMMFAPRSMQNTVPNNNTNNTMGSNALTNENENRNETNSEINTNSENK